MESAEAKMSSAALPPNLSDGLCLLLHADNQQRASLSEFLKMLVAQTVSASSYADCASVLKSKSPHIIIVDAFSLGLDESQLLTLLRTDPILKCTPVVLISQTASEQHMLSLIEAGANDVISRPVQFTALRDSINSVLTSFELPGLEVALESQRDWPDALVIDSDTDFCSSIHAALQSIGYSCQCVHDYQFSSKILAEFASAFQMVIVGLGALSADRGKATKLIQELLEIPAHTNLSLILACEINDISSLQLFYELGIDDHLTKPANATIVQSKFSQILRHRRIRQFSQMQIKSTLRSNSSRNNVHARSSIPSPPLNSNSVSRPTSNVPPSLLSQQLSQIGPRAGSLAEGSIDDFDLLSLLGEGAFGKVLMVRHRKSGKIFAMKILRKSEVVRSDKPRQAIKERQILELIGDQPFVVRLYQSFQDEENLYLILRFAGGGDLFSQLEKRRRLPEDAARFYTAELVLALEALHRAQCVYRDLKPENVLLALNGHVVLTDLGMSTKLHSDNNFTSTSLCGTPEYLAAEIVAGEPHSFPVDWWCLGIILFEMLVGKTPFHSSNLSTVVDRILNENVQIPDYVSSEAASLIKALLERDPTRRLGSRWLTSGGHPVDGAAEIKAHPFFASIRWDLLATQRVTPPFLPLRDEVSIEMSSDLKPSRAHVDGSALFSEFGAFSLPDLDKQISRTNQLQHQGTVLPVGHSGPSRLARSASMSDTTALLRSSNPKPFTPSAPIGETLPMSWSNIESERLRNLKISSLQVNVDLPPSQVSHSFSAANRPLDTQSTSSPRPMAYGRPRAASVSAPLSNPVTLPASLVSSASSSNLSSPPSFISPSRYARLMPLDTSTSPFVHTDVTNSPGGSSSFQSNRPPRVNIPPTVSINSPCPSPLSQPLQGPAQVRARQRLAPVMSPSLTPMVRRGPVGSFIDPRGLAQLNRDLVVPPSNPFSSPSILGSVSESPPSLNLFQALSPESTPQRRASVSQTLNK